MAIKQKQPPKSLEEQAEEKIAFSSEEEFEGFEGFESTDDETEPPTPADPKTKADIKQIADKSGSNKHKDEQTGIVYIGRIPHGLYEDQMREYFEQFGTIYKLRISRNKKTGKSKHYGFIEFKSQAVAKIVCETMNNYLLFGHLLKVELMDPKHVHEDLFVGANSKFHAVPWGLVNKQRAERKHPREYWEQKQVEFEEEKKAKHRKLESMGIIY